ncbi:hypothetical protein SISSUDRAFT_1117469 [Sistotremastrum suecicum HHB10207 ss-3]|uniref:DUF6534 domain-containing protein n=1 Tax=Sistotremastrum suecicum HHB10207 ss-3 TaxID=1314776 RepID=A0A166GGX5_9AGAM|nr:hypothetical protein SISSUDRAFT_1117469 [Sistotremastrum suecicum HHB10207 ss-3]
MESTSIDATQGVLLLGVLASSMLFGFTSFQTLFYFQTSVQDSFVLRILISSLWVLETLHVAFTWHLSYYYLIHNFGDVLALGVAIWSICLTIAVTALIKFLFDAFFVFRIYLLSGRRAWLCTFLALISLGRFVLAVAISIQCLILRSFSSFGSGVLVGQVTACLTLNIVSDSMLTFSLCYFLRMSRTGFSRTNRLLDALVQYSIQNGITIVIVDALVLSFFVFLKRSYAYIAVYQLLSNIYANSLLATLNSRARLGLQSQGVAYTLEPITAIPERPMPLGFVIKSFTNLGLHGAGSDTRSPYLLIGAIIDILGVSSYTRWYSRNDKVEVSLCNKKHKPGYNPTANASIALRGNDTMATAALISADVFDQARPCWHPLYDQRAENAWSEIRLVDED